jgi:hypothetical protein
VTFYFRKSERFRDQDDHKGACLAHLKFRHAVWGLAMFQASVRGMPALLKVGIPSCFDSVRLLEPTTGLGFDDLRSWNLIVHWFGTVTGNNDDNVPGLPNSFKSTTVSTYTELLLYVYRAISSAISSSLNGLISVPCPFGWSFVTFVWLWHSYLVTVPCGLKCGYGGVGVDSKGRLVENGRNDGNNSDATGTDSDSPGGTNSNSCTDDNDHSNGNTDDSNKRNRNTLTNRKVRVRRFEKQDFEQMDRLAVFRAFYGRIDGWLLLSFTSTMGFYRMDRLWEIFGL